MGGIPGSSKGCGTCRKRKKGCDLQRPICGLCLKSNLKCEGYIRPLKIVSYQSQLPIRAAPFEICKRQHSPTEHDALLRAFSINNHRVQESQILAKFWENHMPASSIVAGSTLHLSPITGWLQLSSVVPNTQVLNFTLGALGYARLYLLHPSDARLRQNGMVLYQRSLWEINESLRLFGTKKKRKLEYDLVNACALLGIYEMIAKKPADDKSSVSVGWVTHTKGVTSTMQFAFGPLAWSEGRAHMQFKAMRLNGILLALHEGKSTFLSSEEWKTLPWSTQPRTLHDELVDIMARVPSLIEATRALSLRSPDLRNHDLLSRVQCLIDSCDDLKADLMNWESRMLNSTLVTEPSVVFPRDLLRDPRTFPLSFFGLVHVMELYWVISLIVYTTHDQLTHVLGPDQFDGHNLETLDNTKGNAINPLQLSFFFARIVDVLPFFFRPELKSVGVTNTTFAINVCFRYLTTYGSTIQGKLDAERLKNVLDSLPASSMVAGFVGASGGIWPYFGGREPDVSV